MTLGLNFMLWKNRNFWFQKNYSDIYMYFQLQWCALACETVAMGKRCLYQKDGCSQKWQYDTIMEKKQTGRKAWGRVKDMASSGVK